MEITDAEPLLDWLRGQPDPEVDVSDCASVHLAVLQVLIHAAPRLAGAQGHADWRALLTEQHSLTRPDPNDIGAGSAQCLANHRPEES